MDELRTRVILFGAGKGGENGFLHLCDTFHIVGFSDNDTQKQGRTCCGLPVFHPLEIGKLGVDRIIVCSAHHDAIREQLIDDLNFDTKQIEILPDAFLVRKRNFGVALMKRLQEAINVEYSDNYCERRFGPEPISRVDRLKRTCRIAWRRTGWIRGKWAVQPPPHALDAWTRRIPELEWTYNRLDDEISRRLLVDLVAFRILGYRHIRLPLASPTYRQIISSLDGMADRRNTIKAPWVGGKTITLPRYDLSSIGYPVACHMGNPFAQFHYQQYACSDRGIIVEPDDCVIDAGACWGGSALYFACKASSGEVHAFEFDQGNLTVFKTNMKLNPAVAERIKLVEQPLWSESGKPMFVQESGGPSSKVMSFNTGRFTNQVETIALDDYVERQGIKRVDYIKMDIEGAEEEALRGAKNTIRLMKPKLAICLYHKPDDLYRIPKLIHNLCPHYRFHLKHATMHQEETVLLAKYDG